MSQRLTTSVAVLVLFAIGGLSPALGAEAADNTWTVPRTVDGRPDLQGVWANNNAIPLQRPPEWQGKERLTDGELAELEICCFSGLFFIFCSEKRTAGSGAEKRNPDEVGLKRI